MTTRLLTAILRKSRPYSITRRNGAMVAGRWVEAAPGTFTVKAVIYPSTGLELQRLPEGFQGRQVLTIFTPDELRTAGEAGQADVVPWNGGSYEVKSTAWWEEGGFWACFAERVAEDAA